jgi:ribosomal protein S8
MSMFFTCCGENIVKILLREGFIESFENIRKVTDISWFQLCDIKGERLEREYIELEPF